MTAKLVAVSEHGQYAIALAGDTYVVVDTDQSDVVSIGARLPSRGDVIWKLPLADYDWKRTVLDLAEAVSLDVDAATSRAMSASASRQYSVPKRVRELMSKGVAAYEKSPIESLESSFYVAQMIQDRDTLSIDTIRTLAQESTSTSFASTDEQKIASLLRGGNTATKWAQKIMESHEMSTGDSVPDAPVADSDDGWVDPKQPHEFKVFSDDPEKCATCELPREDPIHVSIESEELSPGDFSMKNLSRTVFALDPSADEAPIVKTPDPDEPHVFVLDVETGLCMSCGRDDSDDVHVSAIAASGFQYQDDCVYMARYVDHGDAEKPVSPVVDTLYMKSPNGKWAVWENGVWVDIPDLQDDVAVVELDEESSSYLADIFASDPGSHVTLSSANEHEAQLAAGALDDEDWGIVDAVFDIGDGIYTPAERADNAKRQIRDGGGRFSPKSEVPTLTPSGPKARLATPLPLVDDVSGRIDQYLEEVKAQRGTLEDEQSLPTEDVITAAGEQPGGTDVRPLYLAIVDEADTEAVLDVVALVPGADGTPESLTGWKRENGKWVEASDLLAQLRSATPPPVVELGDDILSNVLVQIDESTAEIAKKEEEKNAPPAEVAALYGPNGEIYVMTSGGGADRNRGGAERLRRYWLHGEGALKIRWGTDGDWTRCVRHLSKYLGVRAKGYCTLRHKEATGMWPNQKGATSVEELIALAASAATTAYEEDGGIIPETADEVTPGAPFVIPLVIPEGVPSGDGRIFKEESLTTREMPLPLLWQIKSGDGHDGSVVVGRIDSVDRVENGLGNARGVFDSGPYGAEAERMVRAKMLRGISADLDEFEAKVPEQSGEDDELGDGEKIGGTRMEVNKARLMAATLVPKPAFQECYIALEEEMVADDPVIDDGVYEEELPMDRATDYALAALAASAAPVNPPKDWFSDPGLTGPTPLTVTDDGRVFGHIAAWHVDHIGLPFGTKPPRSRSKYAYFTTGMLRTAEGEDIPVGQLTLAGGHAPLAADALAAVKHYDDTASAVADVSAGEDSYGIWVSGALRPSVKPEQVRVLRASSPSGDWRPIKGHLELVAICQVNVPGFPVARARVASGQIYALVAAGAGVLAQMREDPLVALQMRIEAIESKELEERRAAALSRMNPILETRRAAMTAAADEARARMSGVYGPRPTQAELAAARDSVVARFAELRANADWNDALHPRDETGKFRHVLARLDDLLGGDSEGAGVLEDMRRAADLEDSGNESGAEEAARDAKASLDVAVEAAGEAGKVVLREAGEVIEDALRGDAPGKVEQGLLYDELPEPVQEVVERLVSMIRENTDPTQPVSMLYQRFKGYIEGRGFADVEDLVALFERFLRERVTPQ